MNQSLFPKQLDRPRRVLVLIALTLLSLFVVTACSKSESPAASTQVTPAEIEARKAELPAFMSAYKEAFAGRDFEALVTKFLPPQYIKTHAKAYGVSAADLTPGLIEFKADKYEFYDKISADFDESRMVWKTLPDGTLYALIPASLTVMIDDAAITDEDENLLLYSEGQWSVLNVTDAEPAKIFKMGYPQFSDVDFTPTTLNSGSSNGQ